MPHVYIEAHGTQCCESKYLPAWHEGEHPQDRREGQDEEEKTERAAKGIRARPKKYNEVIDAAKQGQEMKEQCSQQ